MAFSRVTVITNVVGHGRQAAVGATGARRDTSLLTKRGADLQPTQEHKLWNARVVIFYRVSIDCYDAYIPQINPGNKSISIRKKVGCV